MRLKKFLIIIALITSIILSGGCAKYNGVQDSSYVNKEEKIIEYSIYKESFNDESVNTTIFYPQIKDYPGELLMDYINQSLKKIINTYGDGENTDVYIDYEVTKQDENILSILFKGKGKLVGLSEINIMQSINIDMISSNEINYNNLVKEKETVMEILNKQAKIQGLEAIQAEGIRVYFKDKEVVFYYMPLDDSEKEFTEVSVLYKEIEKYINKDFGDKPVS